MLETNRKRLNYILSLKEAGVVDMPPGSIHETAVIDECVKIGERSIVGPLAVVGFMSVGAEFDEKGHLVRFPQTGIVEIGDDVTIMAGAMVDRSTDEENKTIVGRRSILGPQSHVGHNVVIGTDTLILGHVQIGGGAIIGDNCMIGQNSIIMHKVKIGKGAIVGAGALITKDVPDNVTVVGAPARITKEHKKRA